MTIGSKSSDKFARPGSGSRPNSSDSAAAIDGSDRIGPGKSGRHHNFDEDKSETLLRRSNDSFRDNDRELEDDRRGRRNSRERSREGRERGDESDRGRDSSSERNTRYREDHRLRNERSELSPHEATASARMHGHISRGEQVDNVSSSLVFESDSCRSDLVPSVRHPVPQATKMSLTQKGGLQRMLLIKGMI